MANGPQLCIALSPKGAVTMASPFSRRNPGNLRGFDKLRSFKILTVSMLSSCLFAGEFSSLAAQDQIDNEPPPLSDASQEKNSDVSTEKIAAAHSKFEEYIQQRKTLTDAYEDLQGTLKQSEQDLQRIQSDGIRKEFQAMQSAIRSMQIAGAINNLSLPTSGQESQATAQMRMQMQQQLLANRAMQNLDAMMNSQELQSLNAEAQRTIRKRYEAIQAAMQLEEKFRQWQAGSTQFLPLYWEFSDPEGSYSQSQRTATLDALRQGDKQNEASSLAQALLMIRDKDYNQAANLLDPITEKPGPMQPIALMAKALVQEKREKEKDAKLAMQASIKLDRANPYCRMLRAQLAVAQKQSSIAETEWKALSAIPNFAAAANRRLALNFAQRSKKTPGDANRAVLAATKALELDDSKSTWFSHYVLALTLHNAGKTAEAIEGLDQAEKLATDELLEHCQTLRKAIDAGDPPNLDW
jgi:hypothetical protein